MRTLLVTGIVAAAVTLNALGQGYLSFANTSATRVFLQDGTPVPNVIQGGTYLAELLYAPDGSPTDPGIFGQIATRVGATTTFNTPTAGVFIGGARSVTSITPPGGYGLFQVRVWDSRAGSTYNQALVTGVGDVCNPFQLGYSPVLRVDTADYTASPIPAPAPLGMPSFSLMGGLSPPPPWCVPEPSTIGLGVLCGAALLMFRRRK